MKGKILIFFIKSVSFRVLCSVFIIAKTVLFVKEKRGKPLGRWQKNVFCYNEDDISAARDNFHPNTEIMKKKQR